MIDLYIFFIILIAGDIMNFNQFPVTGNIDGIPTLGIDQIVSAGNIISDNLESSIHELEDSPDGEFKLIKGTNESVLIRDNSKTQSLKYTGEIPCETNKYGKAVEGIKRRLAQLGLNGFQIKDITYVSPDGVSGAIGTVEYEGFDCIYSKSSPF